MVPMDKYGFKSAAAFYRARNLPESLFDQIFADPVWWIRKRVLLHPDCPLRIRDHVRQHGEWYERIVAIQAKHAPSGYYHHAHVDPDPRVRRTWINKQYYVRHLYYDGVFDLLNKLQVPKEVK